jgi:hypothetical protein
MDLIVVVISTLILMFSAFFYIQSTEIADVDTFSNSSPQTSKIIEKKSKNEDDVMVAYGSSSQNPTKKDELTIDAKTINLLHSQNTNIPQQPEKSNQNQIQNNIKPKENPTPFAQPSQAKIFSSQTNYQSQPHYNPNNTGSIPKAQEKYQQNNSQSSQESQTFSMMVPPAIPVISGGVDAPPPIPTLQNSTTNNTAKTETTTTTTTQPKTETSSTVKLEGPPQIGQ